MKIIAKISKFTVINACVSNGFTTFYWCMKNKI